MRWKDKPLPRVPKDGDMRVIRRFLWFPYSVAGEFRWLVRSGIPGESRYDED